MFDRWDTRPFVAAMLVGGIATAVWLRLGVGDLRVHLLTPAACAVATFVAGWFYRRWRPALWGWSLGTVLAHALLLTVLLLFGPLVAALFGTVLGG